MPTIYQGIQNRQEFIFFCMQFLKKSSGIFPCLQQMLLPVYPLHYCQLLSEHQSNCITAPAKLLNSSLWQLNKPKHSSHRLLGFLGLCPDTPLCVLFQPS